MSPEEMLTKLDEVSRQINVLRDAVSLMVAKGPVPASVLSVARSRNAIAAVSHWRNEDPDTFPGVIAAKRAIERWVVA